MFREIDGRFKIIVEDEEKVRKVSVEILRRQGYRVLEASNGDKALRICEEEKEPIHLILTDVVMPQMSDSELTNRLKVHHPKLKVLYMSGYTENAIVHGILDANLNYIQKPFSVESLAKKVREVLDK